jgi:hypothetical protein
MEPTEAGATTTSTKEPDFPTESSDTTKARDLLAFRTVSTMLSYLTHSNGSRPSVTSAELISSDAGDRKALRVLDAVSAVLVRQHEVIAVVAKHASGTETSGLQVFASVSHPIRVHDANGGFSIRDFTATVNPRTTKTNGHKNDSLVNNTTLPIFGDYEDSVPVDLIAAGEQGNLLKVYLEKHWLEYSCGFLSYV